MLYLATIIVSRDGRDTPYIYVMQGLCSMLPVRDRCVSTRDPTLHADSHLSTPVRRSIYFSSFPSVKSDANRLLNLGTRTTFLALMPEISPACAVDQVIFILKNNPVQTIVKIERKEEHLIKAFTESDIRDRVILSSIFRLETFSNEMPIIVTSVHICM